EGRPTTEPETGACWEAVAVLQLRQHLVHGRSAEQVVDTMAVGELHERHRIELGHQHNRTSNPQSEQRGEEPSPMRERQRDQVRWNLGWEEGARAGVPGHAL